MSACTGCGGSSARQEGLPTGCAASFGREREFVGRMSDLCGCCSLTALDGDLRQGAGVRVGTLREVAASFVVPDPAGVAIRDRLRVSDADAAVLTEVGVYLER